MCLFRFIFHPSKSRKNSPPQVAMCQQYLLKNNGQWLHNSTLQLLSLRGLKNSRRIGLELWWKASLCIRTTPLPTSNVTLIFYVRPLYNYWPILLTVQIRDFFLVKNWLRGKRFAHAEGAVAAYVEELETKTESRWWQCFEVWFKRMRNVEVDGEYCEKMWW